MIKPLCLAALAAATAAPARADDAAPVNYVGGFASTTLAYRPPGGPAAGPQGDVSLALGYGRQVTPALSLELDVGGTFDGDLDFVGVSLVPAAIYGLRPNLYAALRVIIPTPLLSAADGSDAWNLALAPGVGGYWPGVITPIVEANLVSFVGRGDPDVGLSVTAGALYFF